MARTWRVGVMTCPTVSEHVAKMRMRAENAEVDSVEACLNAKNFKRMSNKASTPVG